MKRITGIPTRPDMVQQLLEVGFDYYNLPSTDGSHYWSDNVAYEFSLSEIDKIEDATNELHAMCMDFVADEVKQGDYEHYRFTDLQKNLIEQSWRLNITPIHRPLYWKPRWCNGSGWSKWKVYRIAINSTGFMKN